jgi:predicted HAD superfamily Cof-like phosphohydrolase
MSKHSLDLVQEFHDETGIVTPSFACVPDWTPENAASLELAACFLKTISKKLREDSAKRGAPRCLQRIALEAEELGEKAGAMARYDLLGVLDGAGDGEVVANGTALECGLGLVLPDAVELIHVSNMSKRFPDGTFHRDTAGKILKGPDYVPVNLRPLLARVTKKDQP